MTLFPPCPYSAKSDRFSSHKTDDVPIHPLAKWVDRVINSIRSNEAFKTVRLSAKNLDQIDGLSLAERMAISPTLCDRGGQMIEHAQIDLGNETVGGEVTSQLSNGEWHIKLDDGNGQVIQVSHIDRRAGILKALCRACGFDAWLIQSAAKPDVTSTEVLN